MKTRLRQETLDRIVGDPELHHLVCVLLEVSPASVVGSVRRNGSKINQYYIVTAIAKYLGKHPDDIIEPVSSEQVADSKVPIAVS